MLNSQIAVINKGSDPMPSGGWQNPELILKQGGIELSSSPFWQGSYDVIRSWLEELIKLSN